MRLLTDAILTQLGSGGRRIGDATTPSDDARPYAVLWPLFIADLDGPLGAPDVDGWQHYQLTCVGDTREQSEGLADELRVTVKADYTVPGFLTKPLLLEDVVPTERDDDVQPPVFYQSFTFRVFVTPS